MSEKVTREEFEQLHESFIEFAVQLQERDRHGRGGTTFGEMAKTDAFADALYSILTDPEYVRREVARKLDSWLGERDGKFSDEGWLEREYLGMNIAKLGEKKQYESERHPTPEELGTRASRAANMTEAKAKRLIEHLTENAALCLDLAEAFENRLEEEGGIRRVQ